MALARNLGRFRLVTFDITDTLLRFRTHPLTIYKEEAEKFGFQNIDEERLKKCFRKHFKDMAKKYPNFSSQTESMTWEQWWFKLVMDTFVCADSNFQKTRLSDLASHLVKIFRTNNCWMHVDCGIELVQKVRKIGKCVGVISNFDPSLELVLKEMKIEHLFDFIITSYDAGIQKPERGIFDLALKQINACPEEALHIGNSYELDFTGATKNSGWSGLLVTQDSLKLNDVKREFIYGSLCDMLKALETKDIKW